jgi:hypothetical protein
MALGLHHGNRQTAAEPVADPVGAEPVAVDDAGVPTTGVTTTGATTYGPTHIRTTGGSAGLTAGVTVLGLLTIAIGAWGGIVPYLGPTFGYHANSSGSWDWTWQHTLLYLIPGAVAVATGLWMWGMAARTRAGSGRFGSGLAGLVLLAAGAWFVLGPVVWPIYYSSAVFGPASPTTNFLNQLGYNLGPGLVLAALGGLTLASAAVRRARWLRA